MIITKIANAASIHEKNFEGAIPIVPEPGGPGAGAGEGDSDPDKTVMTSFIGPFLQWFSKPQMYHFLPGAARVMTSCPVVKGLVSDGAHCWNSVPFTLMTL